MLKKVTIFTFLGIFSTLLVADWEIKNINFHMENDADFRTDRAYTYGASIAALYLIDDASLLHIPFTDYQAKDNYISFGYAQQIYTPEDIEASTVIDDDRPYAGYMYLESGLHQAGNNNLKSLIFQIGLVGPSTHMEQVQKFIHDIIGSPKPQGWDNQLQDELTVQVNYNEKFYMPMSDIFDLEANLVPEYGFDLGNVSTKVYGGGLYRFGWNIAHDYGSYAIDNGSYSKIALNSQKTYKKQWGFSFNFSAKANLIAQNIFLDGNTIHKSHSVEKSYFTVNAGYGFSLTYEHFGFDYIRTHTSKEFKLQKSYNSYGSFLFSYNY